MRRSSGFQKEILIFLLCILLHQTFRHLPPKWYSTTIIHISSTHKACKNMKKLEKLNSQKGMCWMADAWSSQKNCWGQRHFLNFVALQTVCYKNIPSLILLYAFLEAGSEDCILQQTDGKIGIISFSVFLYPVSEHSPKTWIQVPTTHWWNESHFHCHRSLT